MRNDPREWSKEQQEAAHKLSAEGLVAAEIGKRIGKTKAAVQKFLAKAKKAKGATPDLRAASAEMEVAALRAENERLRKVDQAVVTCKADEDSEPEDDPAELWRKAEADCERRISKAHRSSRFSIQFPAGRPIALCVASDQHIAPGTPVTLRRMREDAELIASTPGMYVLLGGDATDNHIKHRAAVIAARSQPSDQLKLFDYYLSIMLDKVCVVISGNHDAWANQLAGVDPLQMLCEKNKVHYSPFVARIDVSIGNQSYKVALRHQFRMNSSFNDTHAVKQWQRLGEEDFDVGVICHNHTPAVEDHLYRGRHVVAMRPGSYQVLSAYSVQFGWNATMATCPTVILWPESRRIMSFFDVRDAAAALRLFRGE